MYITTIPNRNSPPAVLLRESFREDGKVRNRTLANLSDWSPARIEALKGVLKGQEHLGDVEPNPEFSLPHGHVAAVLGVIRSTGLDRIISSRRFHLRQLTLALVAGRVLEPSSKLALAQSLSEDAMHSTLNEELGLGVLGGSADAEGLPKSAVGELYEAMDWLLERQEKIEAALAKKHLSNGCTVLYDLSSSYFEGTTCPLAQFGYSRDHRADRPQINYGLLCSEEGIPVAIEVVEGNVGDPKTIPAQIEKLKTRFGLERIVVVGDRGMITNARIHADVQEAGYNWITALRHSSIREMTSTGVIQPSLFDERGIAEITHPNFPGERLIACFNPFMKAKGETQRETLMQLTEKALRRIANACERKKNPLEGRVEIGMQAGAVLSKYKMGKYFRLHIGDHSLRFARNQDIVEREALLDGIYVIRTSVPKDVLEAEQAVLTYKQLSKVERAFRTLKSVDLQVRPIHHRLADRVKAHLFVCMLAYYVEWHLRQAWAELLYADEEGSVRKTPVAPAQPSASAKAKKGAARSYSGFPLQTFSGLMKSLSTLSRIRIRMGVDGPAYTRTTDPTPLQARAFQLIGVQVA